MLGNLTTTSNNTGCDAWLGFVLMAHPSVQGLLPRGGAAGLKVEFEGDPLILRAYSITHVISEVYDTMDCLRIREHGIGNS